MTGGELNLLSKVMLNYCASLRIIKCYSSKNSLISHRMDFFSQYTSHIVNAHMTKSSSTRIRLKALPQISSTLSWLSNDIGWQLLQKGESRSLQILLNSSKDSATSLSITIKTAVRPQHVLNVYIVSDMVLHFHGKNHSLILHNMPT